MKRLSNRSQNPKKNRRTKMKFKSKKNKINKIKSQKNKKNRKNRAKKLKKYKKRIQILKKNLQNKSQRALIKFNSRINLKCQK